ncbi:MAG TPA: DUF58 domain-containing protein [Candidatus Aquilonibacter sp.]|nr:DUF58 domain-containing protein [Candidatus Aquilonibacter sp.]
MGKPLSLDPEFLKTLEELTLLSRDDLSGVVGADHRSRMLGPGLEFSDYRRYSSGDDPRSLDWSAYLRLGKLFLKTYRTEERIPIRLLLDCSASMHFDPAKFSYALHLAAAFSYLALLHLDTVAVAPFAAHVSKPLVVSGGRDVFWMVAEFLGGVKPGDHTDLYFSTKEFLARFPSKGTVLLISDFFDEEGSQRAVEMLRMAGHDLVVLQLHTAEEQRPTAFGELLLEDVETGQTRTVEFSPESAAAYERNFSEFSSRLQRLTLRNGGRYARAVTSLPYQEFVLRGLHRSRVLA